LRAAAAKGKFKEIARRCEGRRTACHGPSTKWPRSPREMLGNTLVTAQTGPAGKQVNRLYIEDGLRHREGILSLDAG